MAKMFFGFKTVVKHFYEKTPESLDLKGAYFFFSEKRAEVLNDDGKVPMEFNNILPKEFRPSENDLYHINSGRVPEGLFQQRHLSSWKELEYLLRMAALDRRIFWDVDLSKAEVDIIHKYIPQVESVVI